MSESEGISRVTPVGRAALLFQTPPFGSAVPVPLNSLMFKVSYGKKCVKLGSKVSLECTQFGCLNLPLIVTITQTVSSEFLLTIKNADRILGHEAEEKNLRETHKLLY